MDVFAAKGLVFPMKKPGCVGVRRWLIAGLVGIGVGGLATPAHSQGLGLPGVGQGVPMMRPPSRPSAQSIGGGAPGQMNQRLGGVTTRPGQNSQATLSPKGAQMMGPRNSGQMSSLSRGGAIMRSGQNMARAAEMGGTNVPGYGNVLRKRP